MPKPFDGHSAANALSAKNAAGNDYLAQLTGTSYVAIYDAADVELVRKNLAATPGTVNGTTGAVTLDLSGTQSTAVAGNASYAMVKNGTDTALSCMDVVQGGAVVAGKMVLSATAITAGMVIQWQNIVLP